MHCRDYGGRKPLGAATESGQDSVCSLLVGGGVPADTEVGLPHSNNIHCPQADRLASTAVSIYHRHLLGSVLRIIGTV